MASTSELVRRAEALGNKVNGAPEHISEVVPELPAMLDEDQPEDVLVAVIEALGHAWTESACLAVVPFADYPDKIGQVGRSPIDGGWYRIKRRFDHGGCGLDAAAE